MDKKITEKGSEEQKLAQATLKNYEEMNKAIESISETRIAKITELRNNIQEQKSKIDEIKKLNPTMPDTNPAIKTIADEITKKTTSLIKKEQFLIDQEGIMNDKILEIKANLKKIDTLKKP